MTAVDPFVDKVVTAAVAAVRFGEASFPGGNAKDGRAAVSDESADREAKERFNAL
ncbi:hypothetical protein [Hydrogenispora ethanolica]|uniref:hypothetical protein n=1 Tax=Hydrogenispora ethanolica TaxID=1082276 RepID=UPI001404AF1F|nr:hypothetical protein [Hydrogenispora ethanolica]